MLQFHLLYSCLAAVSESAMLLFTICKSVAKVSCFC